MSGVRIAWACAATSAVLLGPSPVCAYLTVSDVESLDGEVSWEGQTTVYLDTESFPSAQRDTMRTELAAAVQVWAAVDCARPVVAFGGEGASPDGAVVVRWIDDWASMGFDEDAAATTDLVYESSAETNGARFVSATIMLSSSQSWGAHPRSSADGPRDTRAVLVHELGHALGLAHNCENEGSGRACAELDDRAAMYPEYLGASQATLGDDDIAGLCHLYPASEPIEPEPVECESAEDCALTEVCARGQCWAAPTYGDECVTGSDCAEMLCVETSPFAGVCTYGCAATSDCPRGAECVLSTDGEVSVCAPSDGAAGGCSVAAFRTAAGQVWFVLGLIALIVRRRRSKHV